MNIVTVNSDKEKEVPVQTGDLYEEKSSRETCILTKAPSGEWQFVRLCDGAIPRYHASANMVIQNQKFLGRKAKINIKV